MRITSYGHSAIALDHHSERLTIDPGTFSNAIGAITGAHTVLITHEHLDHVDTVTLRERLVVDLTVEVWAPTPVAQSLAELLPEQAALRIHEAGVGDAFTTGTFTVRVGGGLHALIHRSIPRADNLTYLITADGRTMYHPGDSFDHPGTVDQVDVLFTPVSGPWVKLGEAIDFIRSLNPAYVVPIHDAMLSDIGFSLTDMRLSAVHDYRYHRLTRGQSLDV